MEKLACEVCGKKFKTQEALNQHTNDAHKQQTPVEKEHTPHKKKLTIGKFLVIAIPVLLVALIGYGIFWSLTTQGVGSIGSTHIHADIAIYFQAQQLTPFPPAYYVRSPYMHVEEGPGAGTVLHMHATNVPLRMFFDSLGMKFTSDCFETGLNDYCNDGTNSLKMYVKHKDGTWNQNLDYEKYAFQDLDKILITYGNETTEQIEMQQANVTDFSKDNSNLAIRR